MIVYYMPDRLGYIRAVGYAAHLVTLVSSHQAIKPSSHQAIKPSRRSGLLERGLSLRQIQHLLGHESIEATLIYTKPTEFAEQNAAALISTMIDELPVILDAKDES